MHANRKGRASARPFFMTAKDITLIYDDKSKQPQTKEALASELKRIEHGIAVRRAVIADLEQRRQAIHDILKEEEANAPCLPLIGHRH